MNDKFHDLLADLFESVCDIELLNMILSCLNDLDISIDTKQIDDNTGEIKPSNVFVDIAGVADNKLPSLDKQQAQNLSDQEQTKAVTIKEDIAISNPIKISNQEEGSAASSSRVRADQGSTLYKPSKAGSSVETSSATHKIKRSRDYIPASSSNQDKQNVTNKIAKKSSNKELTPKSDPSIVSTDIVEKIERIVDGDKNYLSDLYLQSMSGTEFFKNFLTDLSEIKAPLRLTKDTPGSDAFKKTYDGILESQQQYPKPHSKVRRNLHYLYFFNFLCASYPTDKDQIAYIAQLKPLYYNTEEVTRIFKCANRLGRIVKLLDIDIIRFPFILNHILLSSITDESFYQVLSSMHQNKDKLNALISK